VALRQSILNGVIPEVLLCLKDSNGKTRDAAYQMLLTMAASSNNIMDYINTVLAGLGAETVHMRSAVVLALSRIVFEYGRDNDQVQEMLPQLLQTVLLLLGKGTRETVKSVVGFCRVCVSAIPSDRLQPLVPELLGSLMKSQLAKNRFRAKVKIIVKKLVKLYGYDALMRYIPQSDTRLLTHMRKLDEREKRRRQANREAATNEANRDDFDGMLDSDEEDSDDGRTLMTGATGLTKSRLSQLKSQGSKITKAATRMSTSGKALSSNVRLPDHDNGEVVDMLGSKMAGKVRFAPEEDSDDDSMGEAMEFDDDGKLVVRDDDADRGNTKMEMDVMHVKSARSNSNSNNKRDRDGDSARGQSVNKNNKRTKRQDLGAAYRSKKAGGDVKRKDQQFEPYAFVPLDGRAFSKKNRRSAVEQMATVVRGKGKKGKR
jgi:ribosomal RNA-processing protein 12